MTLSELSPEALAAAYLNGRQRIVLSDGDHDPLWLWEEWIVSAPEKAWQVFHLLLSQDHDDEALELIVYRLHQLLSKHWADFHERVKRLIREHKELPRFLSETDIVAERYTRPSFTNEEIVNAFLEHYRQGEAMSRIESLIANEPLQALPLIIEIINRGQAYGFGSFDLFSPLRDLLRQHGPIVIESIEEAAKSSVMMRRCLWRMRRHIDKEVSTEPVWQRALNAAGGTTDYNTALPSTVMHNCLANDGEELLSAWFVYEQTSWSFSTVWELTGTAPQRLWELIKAMVILAPDKDTLAYIGAGPLEELLCTHGEAFIASIEQLAASDEKFCFALAGVWQSNMSDELWQRVTNVLGAQEQYPN